MTKPPEPDLFPSKRPPRARRPTWYFEHAVWADGFGRVAGIDEVGRGCLAGPVVAAAVILPPACRIRGLHDSKHVPETSRRRIANRILQRAIAVGIGICSPSEIDELNILWASMEAMRRAAIALTPQPDYLLIDGNHVIPGSSWPCRAIVKGDQRSKSIAAASIVAKTHRDDLMRRHHEAFPDFCWDTNVGYPTKEHYDALAEHGPSPLHRRSFRLNDEEVDSQRDQVNLFVN